MTAPGHIPVLLDEVLAALAPRNGQLYVDGTFGRGGYSAALLAAAPGCRVVAIDRDPDAIAHGAALGRAHPGRLTLIHGRFSQMDRLAPGPADGITLDIGVSSPQVDVAERGFSFAKDGPLDMRMGLDGPTAAEVVNTAPEGELARIFKEYGEERHARRVAARIARARADGPITRTAQLAQIIRDALPAGKPDAIDPATRGFQGLRIHVNDELGELSRGLAAAERLLAPGGRLVVVSFHSLEDRIVKQFLTARGKPRPAGSRHLPPANDDAPAPSFELLTKRPIQAGDAELARNPRARSARLRAARRTAAPPHAAQGEGRP